MRPIRALQMRRTSGGVILPYSPPNYANVELLLVGEGTDAGLLLRDRSGNLRAMTQVGNAQVDTGVNLQGTSFLFDGNSDSFTTPDAADLRIGTSTDFCAETYARFATMKVAEPILKIGASSTPEFSFATAADGSFSVAIYDNAPALLVQVASAAGLLSTATDYHLAVSREGTTIRLFCDGALVASGTQPAGTVNAGTGLFRVGGNSSSGNVDGSQNFTRFTRGQALYTADFVPPVAAEFFDYVEGTGPQVGWNAYDKHANITLSSGWRTALKVTDNNVRSARATRGIAHTDSGYFEVRIDEGTQSTFMEHGIGNASALLTGLPGRDANSWGYYQDDGHKWANNVDGGALGTGTFKTNGDIVQIAFKNGSLWFGKNNTWNGDPAAGTGAAYTGITGTLYPMVGLYRFTAPAHQVTGRFHAWEQTYSAPSGFNYWDV
jgi:hypothetical protein